MAPGEKMFVTPPKSFQLGDKELEVGGGGGSFDPPGMVTQCREAADQKTNQLSRGQLTACECESNHVFHAVIGEGGDAGGQNG